MTDEEIHYPAEFTNRLEILWGEGFLSPGGPEEVREILKDIELTGKSILDIGCGTGGVEIVLVRDLGADRVTGIDVEPQLVECTQERVRRAGIADKVEAKLVKPGPLSFADASFDIVFSKDSMVHIPDKVSLFHEVLRALRPGGVFAASDWLVGNNAETSQEWKRYRELAHLPLSFATAPEMETVMGKAGFVNISTIDRNSWYKAITQQEVVQLEGPLRAKVIEVSDEETCDRWLRMRKALRDSVVAGALRPTHLRAFKPNA